MSAWHRSLLAAGLLVFAVQLNLVAPHKAPQFTEHRAKAEADLIVCVRGGVGGRDEVFLLAIIIELKVLC